MEYKRKAGEQEVDFTEMTEEYLAVISQIERLHRHFLNIVKLELDSSGIRDINNVQAMTLFNIGDAEMTVGELTLRGCYLGSNVSYSLKKMVENGYVEQAQSPNDRRSVHVRLTPKGRALRDQLAEMHRRHAESLQFAITAPDLEHAAATLSRLERFWVAVREGVPLRPTGCVSGGLGGERTVGR